MRSSEDCMRIMLLEVLGWTDLRREGSCMRGTSPAGQKNFIPPNPLTNLNVCHEIEKHLTGDQQHVYDLALIRTPYEDNFEIKTIHCSAKTKCSALMKALLL